jgi:hypothetical protein
MVTPHRHGIPFGGERSTEFEDIESNTIESATPIIDKVDPENERRTVEISAYASHLAAHTAAKGQ